MNNTYNTKFVDTILLSMMDSDMYLGDYERFMAVQSLQFAIDTFNLNEFFNSGDINEEDYNSYFKEIVKTYDKKKHKEYKKSYKKKTDSMTKQIDRDLILESIYDGGYFNDDYEKTKVVNTLQLFFDKFKFEKFCTDNQITEDEYKKYFQKNVQNHYPHKDKLIMKKLEN